LADLISMRDLSRSDVEAYLHRAEQMEKSLRKPGGPKPRNKIVATMFFEPSTRTHMSFWAAAERLGCRVISLSGDKSSSAKGETLSDTVRIMAGYADVLVLRHPLEGAARLAADVSSVPVVNAGDGGNQHPTQTLIDLYSILRLKKKIRGLSVHLVGDLKHARAMRSLLYGLSMFGAKITLCSPSSLAMGEELVREVEEKFSASIRATNEVNLRDCDVLYVCRIQKERFEDQYEAARLQDEFRITPAQIAAAPDDLAILHPLPKLDELPPDYDSDPHAKYFQQATWGVPVRMSVLAAAMGD
jgi:aspartate carbamoyltransferase catalytic subunit